MHVAVGVKPFGILADDDEVHRRSTPVLKTFAGSARAHVRKQIELDPQFSGDIDAACVARRIVGRRNGPKDDAVGPPAGIEDGRGKRRTDTPQRGEPDFLHVPGEIERQRASDVLENEQRRIGNLRADAVAGKHDQIHAITRTGFPARNAWMSSTACPYASR